MEIGKRDLVLQILNKQMAELTSFNTKRMQELGEKQKENAFLTGVYEDYRKHYDYIKGLKQQQKDQIEYLVQYLEDSMEQAGLSDSMLIQAKHEKNKLRGQIERIKKDLDKMIEDDKILLGYNKVT